MKPEVQQAFQVIKQVCQGPKNEMNFQSHEVTARALHVVNQALDVAENGDGKEPDPALLEALAKAKKDAEGKE